MPHDDELDRLKDEQDRAFGRKRATDEAQKAAYQRRKTTETDMNRAYAVKETAAADRQIARERRDAARDEMNRAHEVKQRAEDEQKEAWKEYQRVRSMHGPQIDALKADQQTAHEKMVDAFAQASDAYEARDGSAGAYAAEGREYREERDGYLEEKRGLVDEIREARASADLLQGPLQSAKSVFMSEQSDYQAAKSDYEDRQRDFKSALAEFEQERAEHRAAKVEHEKLLGEYREAKAEAEQAKKAFHERLTQVRSERQERKRDKRSLAEQAGVPSQYQDDVYVSTDADGIVNIYFGGVGSPDGPGHGHYVMDSAGNVTYARDPDEHHGAHNFADYEERQQGILYDRSESTESPRGARGGYDFQEDHGHATQYYEDGTRVSWDLDQDSNQQNKHWTDQNIRKGRDGRHDPPPHAQ